MVRAATGNEIPASEVNCAASPLEAYMAPFALIRTVPAAPPTVYALM
jgi:hypothetical protein